MKGRNPSVPSTYRLMGVNKFSGLTPWVIANPFTGRNWYPIRIPKQIFCGKFDHFAVNTYGDESDWDIYLLPTNGFEDFVNEALPYKTFPDVWPHNWPKGKNGEYCVEAEITPPNARYSNIWFNNSKNGSFSDTSRVYCFGPWRCCANPSSWLQRPV